MESRPLDGELAYDPELPSVRLFSVNQKFVEREGRLTEESKGILRVQLSTQLSFHLPCDRYLKNAEGNLEMPGDVKGQEAP